MKGRALLATQRAVVLLVDGRMEELIASPTEVDQRALTVGDKFRARIGRPIANGTFVTLREGLDGFLRRGTSSHAKPSPVENETATAGDWTLVEVVGAPEDKKAARVSRRLTFRSRLLALTVGAPGVNVSQKIADPQERARLKNTIGEPPSDCGVVVRTAAIEATTETLRAHVTLLCNKWRAAQQAAVKLSAEGRAGLIGRGPDALATAFADWCTPPPSSIEVSANVEREARVSARTTAPELFERLRSVDHDPLETADVDAEINALLGSRVDLGDGAWLAMERTAALIAVDVNTGGASAEQAVNHVAAAEIPRQLRLRGWGGMIAIDFAGSLGDAERRRLETTIRREADTDLRIAGWGPLNLLEATRRRTGPPIEQIWNVR